MKQLVRALLIAALVASCCAASASAAVKNGPEVQQRLSGIAQQGRALGSPRAPITMTYFHELKCPFCQAFETRTLPSLIAHEVRRGQLRIVAQPMAFLGPDSNAAAQTALAFAKQNRYWDFIELFYANQQDETTEYVTEPFLRELAGAIPGANVDAAIAWSGTPSAAAALKKSERIAKKLFVNGTPQLILTKRSGRLSEGDRVFQTDKRSLRRQIKRLRGR